MVASRESTARSPNLTRGVNLSVWRSSRPTEPAMLRQDYHSQARRIRRDNRIAKRKLFEKAYFIHLLQDMIESGRQMAHVDTPGGYIEVDTQQDFEYARQFWTDRHLSTT